MEKRFGFSIGMDNIESSKFMGKLKLVFDRLRPFILKGASSAVD